MRIILLIGCVLLALFCAHIGAPYVYANGDAVNILITVFTVLAGFLMAIIAVLGDPIFLSPGSWRIAEQERENIDRRLIRYSWLFGLYLVTIAVIFVGVLVKDAPRTETLDAARLWIAKVYLFLGSTAFFISLSLPSTLLDMQRARIDKEIEHRRKTDGIND